MSIKEYKEAIKGIIDATNDEMLLKYWKERLEQDVQHQDDVSLSAQEWNLVQEGLEDYRKGNVLSLEDFINKR